MFDILIVGARCAGASLATFMAQQGYKICLIDRADFPSDTLSTHIFGDWSLYKKLGVEDEIKSVGAPEMKRVRIDLEGCIFEGPLMVAPSISGLRRVKYDEILLRKAISYENVTWIPKCSLVDLLTDNGVVTGALVKKDGLTREIRSKVLIGADGRSSTVSRILKPEITKSFPSPRCAFYGYFTGLHPNPIPTFEFYWSGSDMILIHPCDSDLHCICILPPQYDFENWRKDVKNTFFKRLNEIPTIHARMKNAELVQQIKGTDNLESYLRVPYGDGWSLVGDAGAAVHPCSGAGMDQAIATSEMLFKSLNEYFQGTSSWENAMKDYQKNRDTYVMNNMMGALSLGSLPPVSDEIKKSLSYFCSLPPLTHKVIQKIPQFMG